MYAWRTLMKIGLKMAVLTALMLTGCGEKASRDRELAAADILGDPSYRAISYSGWRSDKRADELCPSVEQIKEDFRIMQAMGLRVIRTYNTQDFPQTERTLQALRELREEDADFEMYVMLGAWVRCHAARTPEADHEKGDLEFNSTEINRAIEMAAEYPEFVKIIAVGNEAMVHWQPHHVMPGEILKWVNVLNQAKSDGRIPSTTWITTSDNWAALGGENIYRNADLVELLRSLDFVSLHTYAFHDTFYYPTFEWAVDADKSLSLEEQRKRAVKRAVDHQNAQVEAVLDYMLANGIEKPIHIGETGWATRDDAHYGIEGTCAADEYTSKLFHDAIREWTDETGMSCFYFQAFDEPWKSSTVDGSESHFGLFTVDGKAKAVIWDLVNAGTFKGLNRDGNPIVKTFNGDDTALMRTVSSPAGIKFKP